MTFDSLGLAPELLRAISEQGYTVPTPVQAQAIPVILEGRDLMAGAQTGTGKTAAFTLPLLQRLMPKPGAVKPARPVIRALILTPTRELAIQVEQSVRTYGAHVPLRTAKIFGGVTIGPQIQALRAGIDILVATPGRLLDHFNQRTINVSQLEVLILDEADRMLDMGFIRDIKKILALLPKNRQNLLFSATFSDEIRALATSLLNNPASIDVAPRNAAQELVAHLVHPVDREKKRALLSHIIISKKLEQVLVFTRTKHGANHLVDHLLKDGIRCLAIHGNKSQPQRNKALSDFKAGKIQVLVATDIAARGIDIDQLPHVVNFELPHVPEDYIHRIGRTGRAGSEGEALSLVCVDEKRLLQNIERLLKRPIPSEIIPGFEPDPRIRPEPIEMGRRGGNGSPRFGGGPSRSGGTPQSGNRSYSRPEGQTSRYGGSDNRQGNYHSGGRNY